MNYSRNATIKMGKTEFPYHYYGWLTWTLGDWGFCGNFHIIWLFGRVFIETIRVFPNNTIEHLFVLHSEHTHTNTRAQFFFTEMFCFPLLWRWLVSHLLFYRRARSIDSYRHATTLICGMKIYDYDHVPLKLFHVYHRSYKDAQRTHRVWDIRLEMFSVWIFPTCTTARDVKQLETGVLKNLKLWLACALNKIPIVKTLNNLCSN